MGGIAQAEERLRSRQEAIGSIPITSTTNTVRQGHTFVNIFREIVSMPFGWVEDRYPSSSRNVKGPDCSHRTPQLTRDTELEKSNAYVGTKEELELLAASHGWSPHRARGYVDGVVCRAQGHRPSNYASVGIDEYCLGFRSGYYNR